MLILHYMQLSDDAEAAQEESRVAARAAEIAAEKAAQEVAGPYFRTTLLLDTMLYSTLLYSSLLCFMLPCPALPYPALLCPALPCSALLCPALPCPARTYSTTLSNPMCRSTEEKRTQGSQNDGSGSWGRSRDRVRDIDWGRVGQTP